MATHEETRDRAARTYDLAADHFDHPTNSYWERIGRRTVERLDLPPGAQVLDVCCGAGSSALRAAEAVGPGGAVLGVDVAENLLVLAREKARRRGLDNVDFRCTDVLDLGARSGTYDAVISVFGVYFVNDMAAGVKELWRMVRPGGTLAVTTWGPDAFEPVDSTFREIAYALRPDLQVDVSPWERLTSTAGLRALLEEAGVHSAEAEAEEGRHSVPTPDDWWTVMLGSGLRGTLERLDPDQQEHVRETLLERLRRDDVREAAVNAVYAVATKGA